jgi:hypothetical protein
MVAGGAVHLHEVARPEVLGIARVIGRAQRLVVLPTLLVPEPGDLSSALGAAAIAERAAFRDYGPIRLASLGEPCAGGSGVYFGIANGARHRDSLSVWFFRTE